MSYHWYICNLHYMLCFYVSYNLLVIRTEIEFLTLFYLEKLKMTFELLNTAMLCSKEDQNLISRLSLVAKFPSYIPCETIELEQSEHYNYIHE